MDTPAVPERMFEWHKTTPGRRPRPDNEVAVPEKQKAEKSTLFSGIFRMKLAERFLNDIKIPLAKLDSVLARENYLAVRAAYLQLGVEAALRMQRPDLVKEFERSRDEAILAARQAEPQKKYPKGSRPRRRAV